MDMLNVLQGGLSTPTGSIQFLKSRSGLALSLFNFFRFVRPLVFSEDSTNSLRRGTPCIPTAARADLRQQDTALFGKYKPLYCWHSLLSFRIMIVTYVTIIDTPNPKSNPKDLCHD